MLGLRFLGVGLVVAGVLFIVVLPTRGPAFRLRRIAGRATSMVERFLWLRGWLVRFIGVCLVVGGLIYIVHPPHHLH